MSSESLIVDLNQLGRGGEKELPEWLRRIMS